MVHFNQDQQVTYLLHLLELWPAYYNFQSAYTRYSNLAVAVVGQEYRKFLALKYIHGDSNGDLLAAPKVIYDFWQQHALDTASYLEMQVRLGMQIHFDPNAKDPSTDKAQARRLAYTTDVYKAYFAYDPPAAVWGGEDLADQEPEPSGCYSQQEPIDGETLKQAVDTTVLHTGAGDPFLAVNVRTLSNQMFEVKLNQDVTVRHFRQIFYLCSGYAPDSQIVIFGGKRLEAGHFLMRDCGLRSGDVIHLVLRMRGN